MCSPPSIPISSVRSIWCVGVPRVANLHWAMGDADAADEVISLLRSRVADPMLGLVVDGLAAASLVFENRLVEAADLAGRVLADP